MSNEPVPIDPKFLPAETEELVTELNWAKENQRTLIEKGMEALDELKIVADSSQHPRAYEVLSTMLKTISDINKDFIQTTEKKVQSKNEDDTPGKVINNNTLNFVGTTSDLQDMLKQLKINKGQ